MIQRLLQLFLLVAAATTYNYESVVANAFSTTDPWCSSNSRLFHRRHRLSSSLSSLTIKSVTSKPSVGGLYAAPDDDDDDDDGIIREEIRRPKIDSLISSISLRMRRTSWLSWWAQMILSVISSVTLLFTRNVLALQTGTANAAAAGAILDRNLFPNYFLAGSSIVLSFLSIFWTWATKRLSRRLLRKPTTRVQAANMLRKDIKVGTFINVLGMALALVGAEQIVGGLAIKVLTTTTSTPAVYQGAQAVNLLQPLDILVVQANTNTLFSHFCSLVAYLWLGRSIDQLDPPSQEGKAR
jgi:hypothetical protein